MAKNPIIEVLINRDGLTEKEAYKVFYHCQDECLKALESGNTDEVEDIMAVDLGLELDYVFNLLF